MYACIYVYTYTKPILTLFLVLVGGQTSIYRADQFLKPCYVIKGVLL